jgi:protein gp37
MQAQWVEDIQQQCIAASVAFFFKQWGGTNKKAAGRTLNGKTYDDFPLKASQVSQVSVING